jgi:hypothetical protein
VREEADAEANTVYEMVLRAKGVTSTAVRHRRSRGTTVLAILPMRPETDILRPVPDFHGLVSTREHAATLRAGNGEERPWFLHT